MDSGVTEMPSAGTGALGMIRLHHVSDSFGSVDANGLSPLEPLLDRLDFLIANPPHSTTHDVADDKYRYEGVTLRTALVPLDFGRERLRSQRAVYVAEERRGVRTLWVLPGGYREGTAHRGGKASCRPGR